MAYDAMTVVTPCRSSLSTYTTPIHISYFPFLLHSTTRSLETVVDRRSTRTYLCHVPCFVGGAALTNSGFS